MNSVSLIGNIATSLTLRTTKTKKAVCEFNVAVDRINSDETDFIPVTAWETTAMNLVKYCDKGSKIGITGHLAQSSYVDTEGKKRSKVFVRATVIEFLSTKPKNPDFTNDFEDEIVNDEVNE